MKKSILTVAAIFISAISFSQDLTSKKGEVILPEEGDWAIGFDAAPFLNYAGNLFNSGNSSPTANFIDSSFSIYGKYFMDEQTAIRARVRIGFSNNTERLIVPDVAAIIAGDTTATGDDELKNSRMDIVIGVGFEKRRGNTRLQGFYGGEFLLMLGSAKSTYSYVNDYSPVITAPPTSDFGSNLVGAGRVTEMKQGGTFGVGLQGFIGVEYFIFPKISVAAEYTWGLAMYSIGESEVTVESLNALGTAGESVTTRQSAKQNWFGVDTGNNGGSLRMMFHF